MDDVRIGQALRTIRVRKRLRQTDVAQLAGVRRDEVIALERGRCGGLAWHKVKAVATALGASIGMELRWQGADLDRLLSEGHAALHGFVGRHLLGLPAGSPCRRCRSRSTASGASSTSCAGTPRRGAS